MKKLRWLSLNSLDVKLIFVLSKMYCWLHSSCCTHPRHSCTSVRCMMSAADASGNAWSYEVSRKQCCVLISLRNYHSCDGAAVWLSLMVSPRSLHLIKQPHQPILSFQPLVWSVLLLLLLLQRTSKNLAAVDGINPHLEDKHSFTAAIHDYLIIQGADI